MIAKKIVILDNWLKVDPKRSTCWQPIRSKTLGRDVPPQNRKQEPSLRRIEDQNTSRIYRNFIQIWHIKYKISKIQHVRIIFFFVPTKMNPSLQIFSLKIHILIYRIYIQNIPFSTDLTLRKLSLWAGEATSYHILRVPPGRNSPI